MIQFSNAISDAVLATVCIVVFFRFFARLPYYSRILWGIFLVTTALAAAAGVFRFLGFQQLTDTHRSLSTLAGSVGLASVVVAIWGLVMRQSLSRFTVILTIAVGLILFVTLLYPAFSFRLCNAGFNHALGYADSRIWIIKKIPKSHLDCDWSYDHWIGN